MNFLILLLMLMGMSRAECECGGNPFPSLEDPNFVWTDAEVGGKCGTFRCAAGFYPQLLDPETNKSKGKETFNREFRCAYDGVKKAFAFMNGEPGKWSLSIDPNKTKPTCMPAKSCSDLNPLKSVCASGNYLCGEVTFDDNDKTTCDGENIIFEKEKQIEVIEIEGTTAPRMFLRRFHVKKVECGKTDGVWYAMDGEKEYEPVPAGTSVTCEYRRASSTTTAEPTTDLTATGPISSTTADAVTTTPATSSTTAEPSTAPPQQQAANNLPLAIGLGVSCGVAFGILAAALVVLLYLRRSKKRKAAPETTRNHSYDRNSAPKETWQERWKREGHRRKASSHQKTIAASITPSSEMPSSKMESEMPSSSKMEENSLGTYDTTITANRDSLGSFKD